MRCGGNAAHGEGRCCRHRQPHCTGGLQRQQSAFCFGGVMDFLNRLLMLMASAVLLVFGALLAINWQSAQRIGVHVERFVEQTLTLAYYCLAGAAVFAGLVGVTVLTLYISRRRNENRRQRDGSFPLQQIRVGDATVLVDPNKLTAPAVVVSRHGIAEVFTAAADVHLQHALARSQVAVAQALAPGDAAIAHQHGAMYRPPALAGAARQLLDERRLVAPPQRQLPDEQPASPVEQPQPQRLRLRRVIESAEPQRWFAGQDEAGNLAHLDISQSIHAGIVGATGTGKTSSLGYTLAAQAIRTGHHLVILDPKGGVDWRPWAGVAEWHASDPTLFPQQVAALWRAHERRLASGGVPTVVLIEEYGDLIGQLRRTDRQAADETDNLLDRLMRLSRASRIHLLLIDQYPEHWSQQVIANTKWLAAFRLGPNQGAKVREYNADRLPDRGRFQVRGKQYDAWFAAPHLDRILALLPERRTPDVIDGEFTVRSSAPEGVSTSGEQAMNGATNGAMNAPTNTADWYEWTLANYLPAHPELLQVDANGRGVGVSALARAMAELARGDAAQMEAYKGVASEVAKRLRSELRLPGGERLGTDISHTAAAQ